MGYVRLDSYLHRILYQLYLPILYIVVINRTFYVPQVKHKYHSYAFNITINAYGYEQCFHVHFLYMDNTYVHMITVPIYNDPKYYMTDQELS